MSRYRRAALLGAIAACWSCSANDGASSQQPGARVDAGKDVTADSAWVDAQEDPYESLLPLYDYDATAPLDIQVVSTQQGDVIVEDLSYQSVRGRVPAYLVRPAAGTAHPGLVFLHWGQGDRTEFLTEATALATSGAVCLLIDAPWKRPGEPTLTPDESAVQIIVDLRRGIDLLQQRPDVASDRLAFVGHSYGGSRGGVLVGVDKRLRAGVLMTGYAKPSAYDGATAPSSQMDGINYIGHAAPTKLLFQFGKKDPYITQQMVEEYTTAASEPKTVKWYDAGHALDDYARQDRGAWLKAELGL